MKASTRNALPSSEFGLPGSRKYPMPNKSHAVNAEARATQMVKKGKLSASAAARIRAKARRVLGGAAVVLMALCVPHAHAAVKTYQVTIGASATQVSTTNVYCKWVVFQNNNASDTLRIGDSTVSSTIGILLGAGSPGGSFTTPPTSDTSARNLANWYVFGTNGDKLDVTCETVNF